MSELSPELVADLQKITFYLLIIYLVVWLLFALTVRNTLRLIDKENQLILPSQAWFLALPLFNIYWNFEVSKRLAYSFNNEFFDRKIAVEEMPTRKAGMIYAWAFLVYFFPLSPGFVRVAAMLIFLIYFVVYWIQINQYKTLLEEHNYWKQNEKESNENQRTD